MSIDNIESIKPDPKNVELDILGKYKTDLKYLKNGKKTIERKMAEKGIDNETINKKLKKLNKSIGHIEKLIEDYEKDIENRFQNDSSYSEEDDEDANDDYENDEDEDELED